MPTPSRMMNHVAVCLAPEERAALAELLDWATNPRRPELVRAILFGSRARGDHDETSDLDLLLIFAVHDRDRHRLAPRVARTARKVGRAHGVPLQSWTLGLEDLARGRRTPMLVDAVADGFTLWPPAAPPMAIRFTPADAAFCARRLLEWVADGGPEVRHALAHGRRAAAARRTRDDITRMAAAAVLVTGETRHRRTGSLCRFADTLLGRKGLGLSCAPALDWAAAAYPPDDGRGSQHPPASALAAATAELGYALAAEMEAEVVPWIRERLEELATSPAATLPAPPPPARWNEPPPGGTSPGAAP